MAAPVPPTRDSFTDRLRAFSLGKWGAITIFSAALVSVLISFGRPTGRLNAQERAQLYGSYTAVALLFVVGIVLVVLHFVRRRKR